MGITTLIDQAHAAGLILIVGGDRLVISGLRRAESIAWKPISHKDEVSALLIGPHNRRMSTLVLKTASDGPAGQQADSPISADSQSPGDLFERADWTLFRSLTTLSQKAGVPSARLPRLIAKELADNALDVSGFCRVELLDGNGFWVEDDGDGIPGDDRAVASLFSINRPLASSKIFRRPSRGALGNGLRVVTGAILASAGTLHVSTRGRTLQLLPQVETGETLALPAGDYAARGTRVEVRFGPPLRVDRNTLAWARQAILLSQGGPRYAGKPSPHWYDGDAFYELLQASGQRTVRELIAAFDGCAEPKAGKIAAPFKGRWARSLQRVEADRLLKDAKDHARVVKPNRLGCVGRIEGLPSGYAKSEGELPVPMSRDRSQTVVPVVIEAWAELGDRAEILVFVNRTPVAAEIKAYHKKDTLILSGCGLSHAFKVGRKPPLLVLNVETPYMPITSDGKAPDLSPIVDDIEILARKILKRVKPDAGPIGRGPSQKEIILAHLDEAVAKAGGDGAYRFSLRQLFYAVRPHVLDVLGKEPGYDYFAQVVTEHEAERGEIPGMYRDPRGTLYHPHTGEEIPLGTLNVEDYRRPAWTFNKILYCEKEGFFPILRAARWPERHDCVLMTSKGFASRAARDVLDLLGETGEDLYFFCIHDADAYGTMIFQALQEATRARGRRKVSIINLGLEPAEALEMKLQVETVSHKGAKTAPVAKYVDKEWREWLQENRVELNAMTTPQFLDWLESKFQSEPGKVVPPDNVLKDRFRSETREILEHQHTARVLREAGIDRLVAADLLRLEPALAHQSRTLPQDVARGLVADPSSRWTDPVSRIAQKIVLI